MIRHFAVAAATLMLAGHVAAADTPAAPARGPDPATMEADAAKLCERLAGTEREICLRQARENRRMAEPGGIGAPPNAPGGGAGQSPLPPSGGDSRTR